MSTILTYSVIQPLPHYSSTTDRFIRSFVSIYTNFFGDLDRPTIDHRPSTDSFVHLVAFSLISSVTSIDRHRPSTVDRFLRSFGSVFTNFFGDLNRPPSTIDHRPSTIDHRPSTDSFVHLVAFSLISSATSIDRPSAIDHRPIPSFIW